MGAGILVLQWQGEKFFQVEKFETSNFEAAHCVRKNAISPKIFTDFQNLDVDSLGRKFHERSYFSFAMAR